MVKFIKGVNRKQAGLVPAPVLLLGALLLTLVITGGAFAYSYTTQTVTIGVGTPGPDFADVSANNTPNIDYNIIGKRRGGINANTLFNIDGASVCPDVEVQVYLANPDELSKDYSFWLMRLELKDGSDQYLDQEGITKIITLNNPVASFTVESANITSNTAYVENLGGSYRAFPYSWLGSGEEPVIFCKVLQHNP